MVEKVEVMILFIKNSVIGQFLNHNLYFMFFL